MAAVTIALTVQAAAGSLPQIPSLAVGAHDLYLLHREAIERALTFTCKRNQVFGPDAEDFCSAFRLHLMEDDYKLIRRFENRSSIQTYLMVAVTHAFQDWRNARWGKWRPSAEAKRLGPTAVHLETLLVRDRLSVDAAHELLRTQHGVTLSRREIDEMASRFPQRGKRTFVPESEIGDLTAPDRPVDEQLIDDETASTARRAIGTLRKAIAGLATQDQLIVRMLVLDCLSVADIARTLRLEQKPLYRRIDRLKAELREHMEREGVSAEAVVDLLQQRAFDRTGTQGPDDELYPRVVPIDGARGAGSAEGRAK